MRNVFIRADKRGRVHTEKSRKIFYIFCSLRRTRLPCGEGADFSETAQAHCCPCAAFQGLKKHHVQFCLFSVGKISQLYYLYHYGKYKITI